MIMEVKLERKYEFLRKKYNELLLPTFFMEMSEKICTLIDLIIIGFFIGSSQLAVLNLANPITYFTGIFYVLFGQGGSLLALRAQSQLNNEKSNFYFTFSILGMFVVAILLILVMFFFIDNILMFFNVPGEIYDLSKEYLLIFMFFHPINRYLIVISYFIRSDGHPKMPFYAVLTANILNIFFDILFLNVFHLGIAYTALASVLGYLVSSIYISKYLFDKNASFKLISLAKFKVKDMIFSLKELILNTPEVVGRILLTVKTIVLTYLCSIHYGVAGLLAFLVYDNSEYFIYMFLSGIMKTMSPIVTVLYKEMDFEAVHYIIVRSIKQILVISFPVSVIFFVYPQILLSLFNISDPQHVGAVVLAIRITAFSVVSRCMILLLESYAQAIEENKIASIMAFLEEFLFAVAGALILTRVIGGIGIWISILVAECIPVLIYIIYSVLMQKKYKNIINRILMLQNSKLITWTYSRKKIGKTDKYLDKESRPTLLYIESVFKDDAILISNSIRDICYDLFEENKDLQDIDLTIRLIDEEIYVVLTTDGKLYNPFLNESLMNSNNIVKLSKLGCEFDYNVLLGFNKSYLKFKEV